MEWNPKKSPRIRGRVGMSAAGGVVACLALSAGPLSAPIDDPQSGPTLEETRLTMGKWIETQQIISKERNDWQQGKEILQARLELVQKEIASLEEKIQQAQAGVEEADRKRAQYVAEDEQLKVDGEQLAAALEAMEKELMRLVKALPEPLREKIKLLVQRIPDDPANTRVNAPERFQNVLGILNELNKSNGEIAVNYEVRNLSNGKPSEVRALYIGLGQGYYVSASGEAGIGTPGADGWIWRPSNEVAGDVLTALEVLQGKHTPTFVPLPVRIQ